MNSKDSRPVLTYMIIMACVIIMIHLSTLPQDVSNVLYNEYALRPRYLTHGMRIISVVTYSSFMQVGSTSS